MSTICAEECFALDMEWYGVDRQGHIAVFCSAGEGNLPKFVCEDRERADQLIEYFGGLEQSTGSTLLFPKTKRAEQVAREFSDRGLYYFDADDGTRPGISTLHKHYTQHSRPQIPLRCAELPGWVRELLRHQAMEIEDFSLENTVHVKHAYE